MPSHEYPNGQRAGVPDGTRYDHTSIPATLRAWFAPGMEPLSRREKRANTFSHVVPSCDSGAPQPDLPDLSAFCTPRPPASPPRTQQHEPAVPSVANDDGFARQLHALAEHVDRRLDGRPPGPPPVETLAAVPAVTPELRQVRTDEVAARFVRRAEATRSGNPD
jgi:hypothetical protein